MSIVTDEIVETMCRAYHKASSGKRSPSTFCMRAALEVVADDLVSAEADALRARVVELEEALKPFASFATDALEDDIDDKRSVRLEVKGSVISARAVKHFRRAARLLAKLEDET